LNNGGADQQDLVTLDVTREAPYGEA
jgi:hypothetical protein